MDEGPIMKEIRAFRAAYAKKFGYDIARMVADLQRQDAEEASVAPAKKTRKPSANGSRSPSRPVSKPSKRRRAA